MNAIHVEFLGEYAGVSFDPRVAPLLARYRDDLAGAERTIEARNGTRLFPYVPLLPSRTTASIES